MKLEVLEPEFSVCKAKDIASVRREDGFCFFGKTDTELSLVCETRTAPADTTAREDGWKGIRVAGAMEFSLVGVLAKLSAVLAKCGIPIFAVSTYDTDYIFVKAEHFHDALKALGQDGHELVFRQ